MIVIVGLGLLLVALALHRAVKSRPAGSHRLNPRARAGTGAADADHVRHGRSARRTELRRLFLGEHQTHSGPQVCFKGEMIQVIERGNDRFVFRINVTKATNGWKDATYVTWKGQRFLEEDVVEFVGPVLGLKTYKSVFDQNVTIPGIRADVTRLVAADSPDPPSGHVK